MAATDNKFTLLVDDHLRYVYCRVSKVASTSWSRVLLVASGKVNSRHSQANSNAYVFILTILKYRMGWIRLGPVEKLSLIHI